MRKRIALVVVVFLLGLAAMVLTGKFGIVIPFIAWATLAIFEESLLETTKISSGMTGSMFLAWAGLWFFNGPVLFRNDAGIVHNLGPSLHDLVLAIAGSVLCFLVAVICHYVEKGLPTRYRFTRGRGISQSDIKRYRG